MVEGRDSNSRRQFLSAGVCDAYLVPWALGALVDWVRLQPCRRDTSLKVPWVGSAGADVLSTALFKGSPWSCRQQGRAGGPKEPSARGGGTDPRTVVGGGGGRRQRAVSARRFRWAGSSTSRWCISASSSRSWWGMLGSQGDGVITTSSKAVPVEGRVGRLSM